MSGKKVVYKTTYAKGEGTRTAARQTPKEHARKAAGGSRAVVVPREAGPEAEEQPSVAVRATHAGRERTPTPKDAAPKAPAKTRHSPDGSPAGKKPTTTAMSATTAHGKTAKGAATAKRRSPTPAGASAGASRASSSDATQPKAPAKPPAAAEPRQPPTPTQPATAERQGQSALSAGEQSSSLAQPKPRHVKRLEPPQVGELAQPRRAPHASRSVPSSRQSEEAPRDRTTIVLPAIGGEPEPGAATMPVDEAATREMAAIERQPAIEQQPTIELRAASRAHTVPLTPPGRRRSAGPPMDASPLDADLLDTELLQAQPGGARAVAEQATIVPRPLPRPSVPSAAVSLPRSSVRRATAASHARRARWRLSRGRKIALGIAALLVIIVTAAGVPLAINYVSLYQRDTALASTAMAHLKSAETALSALQSNPLDSVHIAQAQSELAAAHTNFWQIQGDLASLPGIASSAPVVGDKLAGARKLLPLALEATQGGILALSALALVGERLKDPFGAIGTTTAKAAGLTTSDWATLTADFNQIDGIFATAVQQIDALQPSDLTLDARLGPAVQSFRKDLPNIESGLAVAQTLIALGPQLLGIGSPVNYLVEVLDSTELRPGGGFVGNYGFLTMNQGLLGDVKMRDVDLLDRSPANLAKYIPVPAGYSWFDVASSWGLRDSNIEANFPTSAQFGEQLLKELGDNTPVQGVITITPWLIQNAMKITGPIYVPQFKETVSADDLINTIHKYQLGAGHGSDLIYDPASGSSQRKAFSADLFAQFIALVKKDLSSHMSQFVRLFTSSFQTKDIQIYLNSAKAEALLAQYNLAATIASPPGDGLMVVDANITGNKANYFINYTMNDAVTLDAQGNATHHTTLTYAWPISAYATANEYGGSAAFIYDDYVRVYAPAGSSLLNQSGWAAAGTSTAYNRAVFAGHLSMSYGQTAVITLDWTAPHAATHDASGWHYATLLQKQAGDTWKFTEQVTLPKGCAISGTPGLLARRDASHAALTQYLTTDVSLKLDYGGCS